MKGSSVELNEIRSRDLVLNGEMSNGTLNGTRICSLAGDGRVGPKTEICSSPIQNQHQSRWRVDGAVELDLKRRYVELRR
jgi:hypothetical protein